jgi:hypothetical protein
MSTAWRSAWTGLVLVLLLAGCSASRTDRLTVYPVSGKLLVKGQPAAGAKIRLDPLDSSQPAGLCPHAIVDADGGFRLTTYTSADGAPAGTYALTVKWPLPPSARHENDNTDRLKGRYADPKHPVRQVEIKAGDNDLGTSDLK